MRIPRRARSHDGPADDAELLDLARAGDDEAFAELYERHEPMARRAAAHLAQTGDVDDIVAEAFARTLSALRKGGGPQENFPGYVYTAVRRTHIDRLRRNGRYVSVEPGDLNGTLVEDDGAEARLTASTFHAAFASLKPRWRRVLWLCEVERLCHAEVGEALGMRPNAVAALAYRARRALQDAYLREHVAATADPACAPIRALLPAHVNGRTSAADAGRVEAHVQTCDACRTCLADLREARVNLGVILLPVAVAAGGKILLPAAGVAGGALAAPAEASAASGGGFAGFGGFTAAQTAAAAAASVAVITGAAVALVPGGTSAADHVATQPPTSLVAPDRPRASPTPSAASRRSDAPATTRAPAPPTPEPSPRPSPSPTPPPRDVDAPTRPAPAPAPAPVPDVPTATPQPTPEPTPDPTPAPKTVPNPRISLVDETDSQRGPAWRRIVLTVDDVSAGDSVRLRTTGASGYCLRVCSTLNPDGTWIAWWSIGSTGRWSVALDVLPARRMVLDIALTTSAPDDDPADNTAQHTLDGPIGRGPAGDPASVASP